MKIWLMDEEKFATINNLKEVTNPIMFEKGMMPTEDGLFSNTIFGMSVYDRKHNWGYINLKGHYLHPKVYITLKALNKAFENIIYGSKTYTITEGELVESDNGGTGLEWLYSNWNKIDFKKNDSGVRSTRIDMVKNHKRDELFVTKWAVCPAFYRDVNMSNKTDGKPKIPELNDMYAGILRNVNLIEEGTSFDFMLSAISGKTQELLVDIYNLMKTKLTGKNGYLRRAVLGKSVDYCSRIVMTSTPYDTNSVEDQPINFYNTGIPLAYSCIQSTPFIIWWVNRFFQTNVISNKDQFPVINDKLETVYVKLDNPEVVFNDDYIDKNLNRWIHNPSSRFNKIELPIREEDRKKYGISGDRYLIFRGHKSNGSTIQHVNASSKDGSIKDEVIRPMTWTDILYMAAVDVLSDKHVAITRYPMLDYLGIQLSRIHVVSTRDTMPMIVDGVLYKYYPVINLSTPKSRIESLFIDAVKLSPLYLGALDGDFDGDQITSKILFSKEANEDAEKIMFRKSNFISVDFGAIRGISTEGIQTLYTLTRFHKK